MRLRLSGSFVVLVGIAAACGGLPDEPVPLPPMSHVGAVVPLPDDPTLEFDFWLGEWAVVNRHLQRSGRWKDGGTAVARIQSVADGAAVLERWTGEARGDRLIGFSLRAWDPSLGKWVIYLNWHGGSPAGFFVMHGERRGERVELFPPGDQSQLRYSFSEAHEGSALWDSAVSRDGGTTWITEWVMQFTRTAGPQSADATSVIIERPPAAASKYEETRLLDGLLGTWQGTARLLRSDGTWEGGSADVRVTSMIEGYGLLQFFDTSWGEKTLAALGFDTELEAWSGARADSGREGLRRLVIGVDGESVVIVSESPDGSWRETWRRLSDSSYGWSREVETGGSWRSVLTAELNRLESP